MSKIEYKTFSFELKEVDGETDEGVIEGYASTFGNLDQGFDIVEKGAFKKTLKDNKGKFPILADHNPYEHIGWNEKASEDDTGLLVRGSLMLKVQKGAEKYALAKKAIELKAPMGLSIGYTTITAEPDKENIRIRRLKELKLWEYSLVTFPMNTQAMVTAAKNIGEADKAAFLISQLKAQGVSIHDLELALRKEAADLDYQPTKITESLDNLIAKFRNG
jgi:HK97 family phage prohead protease